MAYNEVSDVSPLSMIDTLQLVDLESNNIETLDQVNVIQYKFDFFIALFYEKRERVYWPNIILCL